MSSLSDPDGRPVPGAYVEFHAEEGQQNAYLPGGPEDVERRYYVNGILPGRYRVRSQTADDRLWGRRW